MLASWDLPASREGINQGFRVVCNVLLILILGPADHDHLAHAGHRGAGEPHQTIEVHWRPHRGCGHNHQYCDTIHPTLLEETELIKMAQIARRQV